LGNHCLGVFKVRIDLSRSLSIPEHISLEKK
jgi:hypothetical protein